MCKKDTDKRVLNFTRHNEKENIIIKLQGERCIITISSGDRAKFDLGKLARKLSKDNADQVEVKDATKLVLTKNSFKDLFKVCLVFGRLRG